MVNTTSWKEIKPKRPSIRARVMAIPLLNRVKGGHGFRYDLRLDVTKNSVTIIGIREDGHHEGDSREQFYFNDPAQVLNAGNYFQELLMRAVREARYLEGEDDDYRR